MSVGTLPALVPLSDPLIVVMGGGESASGSVGEASGVRVAGDAVSDGALVAVGRGVGKNGSASVLHAANTSDKPIASPIDSLIRVSDRQ